MSAVMVMTFDVMLTVFVIGVAVMVGMTVHASVLNVIVVVAAVVSEVFDVVVIAVSVSMVDCEMGV